LSDDPLICTGSANFSENSLTSNDENMVLIRGATRLADIYMTEFDRLFRHFYFRDIANEVAMKRKKGAKPEKVFLSEDDRWTESYFRRDGFKSRRREMFFHLPDHNWTAAAAQHPNEEPVRPKKTKTGETARKTTKKKVKKAAKKRTVKRKKAKVKKVPAKKARKRKKT
jgi:phosphatidylserine/phosphatidylglycerophosphate/cardiolipin synthase-like enzyme